MEEKFRVYDVENNTYVNQHHNPIFMDCETGEIYLVDYASPDPKNLIQSMEKLPADKFIVEQDTGLKDKNGRKIYDGDIVKMPDYRVKPRCEAVKYYKAGFNPFQEGCMECWSPDGDEVEVIGNIHENPELLGGEE